MGHLNIFHVSRAITNQPKTWIDIGEGFVVGNMWAHVLKDQSRFDKWTELAQTVLLTLSSLNSAQKLGFFNYAPHWIQPIKYTILAVGALNFLKAFFHSEPVILKSISSHRLVGVVTDLTWMYTAHILAITSMVLTALELQERPLKLITSLALGVLTYRALGEPTRPVKRLKKL